LDKKVVTAGTTGTRAAMLIHMLDVFRPAAIRGKRIPGDLMSTGGRIVGKGKLAADDQRQLDAAAAKRERRAAKLRGQVAG
jgi:hypothetical protein